ncbi:MAG: hypothetical protein ACJAS4_001466 [Bacteriovoracaceae bacterium]|jgi:hypothetical protein
MKILTLGFALTMSLSAFAISFSDITGTYEITTDLAPIVNTIEIDKDGNVSLTENSPYGTFSCTGAAVIEDQVLTSEVTCENGATFTQRVDFEGINNFEEFSANVYSSLYEAELPMNFKKLK